MKKKLKSETKTFPSVILYNSELVEIWQLFTGLGGSVQITDNDFEYQILDEVKEQRGQQVKLLTIESDSPALSLKLGQGKTELHYGGQLDTISAYAQLQAILRSSRRPVLHFFFNIYTLIGAPAFLILAMIIARPPYRIILVIPFVVSVFLVFGLSQANREGGFSRIMFMNRHEATSIWTRNKDKIIVGIGLVILTAFITWLVTYLSVK